MTHPIEDTICSLLAQLPDGQSLDPNMIAKSIDLENWRRILPQVRSISIGLARRGQIEILRKGKPVSPEELKGIYRLRAIKNPATV